MFNSAVLKIGDCLLSPEDLIERLDRYQILPQLVREVIIDEAIATIDYTPQELEYACEQFYQKHQLANPQQQLQWHQQQGISPEQLTEKLLRQIKIAKFTEFNWSDQLRSYFIQRRDKLNRAVYWLLRTQDREIAQELYFRLEAGEADFFELANQYSQGSEARTGGIVGPVELGTLHPVLAKTLASSQVGKVCQPLSLGQWLVIVRLQEWLPAQLDEAMRKRLLDEMFNAWLKEEEEKNLDSCHVDINGEHKT